MKSRVATEDFTLGIAMLQYILKFPAPSMRADRSTNRGWTKAGASGKRRRYRQWPSEGRVRVEGPASVDI